MPILQEDVYIKKAAVQDDTAFGGGGMTNNDVVDGQSNNWFPDSSDVDRAFGRVQFRKGFGVALTDDTDTLQGALAILLRPPEDPLVQISMFETGVWGDRRLEAQTKVERYLVKGPLLLCRIQGVHYAGSLILQLYAPAPGQNFPEPGGTVVVRNPTGTEQYLRVLRTTISQAIVTLNGTATTLNICSCELSEELVFDVQGRDIQTDNPSTSNTAVVYSTTPAMGAKFYGVKKLGVDAVIGDSNVTVSGGIFTNLVPANTVETPVIDVYPLVKRASVSRTATATVSLSGVNLPLGPGAVFFLPTAAEPGTMIIVAGATFTEASNGELITGSTTVGRVYHSEKRVEFYSTSPSYGNVTAVITYKPATVTGAGTHSGSQPVDSTNQGLGWTFAFEPAPAPATLTVHYLAQGRWYTLYEDGTGKLSGSDSSYGSGTLNFTSGSLLLTLGALPDVGSDILFIWGDAASARQATGTYPNGLRKMFVFTDAPVPGSISFAWTAAGSAHSAILNANGTVTGAATIGPVTRDASGLYSVWIQPTYLADGGTISMTYQKKPEASAFTNSGAGAYVLTSVPVKPGTIRFQLLASSSGFATQAVWAYDDGAGLIMCQGQPIGTVNYATGDMVLSSPSINQDVWKTVKKKVTPSGSVVVG